MIDALIAHFTDQRRRKVENNEANPAEVNQPPTHSIEEGDEGLFFLYIF